MMGLKIDGVLTNFRLDVQNMSGGCLKGDSMLRVLTL